MTVPEPCGRALTLALSLVFALTGLSVTAQNRNSSASNELLFADQQTVTTATKRSEKVADSPEAVTVITEEDIRASGLPTLVDFLKSVPGLDIIQTNMSVADVSVRGLNQLYSNKLLVLLDGHSVMQDYYGFVIWAAIPVEIARIKRIEIVRGPGSALYGANALNGVINIITKTPAELAADKSRFIVRSLDGSQNSTLSELVGSFGDPKSFSWTLSGAYNRTDGFGMRQPGQVRDSYTVPIESLDFQEKTRRGSIIGSVSQSDATIDQDSSLAILDAKVHNAYQGLSYSEDKGKDPILARFSATTYLTNGVVDGNNGAIVDERAYEFELQQQRIFAPGNSLIYGFDAKQTTFSSSAAAAGDHSQSLWSLYAQDENHLGRSNVLFTGVRIDNHSVYGTEVTPKISLVHHFEDNQTVRASYGTAFRNPTLLDTYQNLETPVTGALTIDIVGNRNLKPESVRSFELGYRKEGRSGFIGVNAYYDQISALISETPIAFQPSPPFPAFTPSTYQPQNGGGANSKGFEIESEVKVAPRVKGVFNYAFENITSGAPTALAESPPRHKINLGLQTDTKSRFQWYVGLHFVDSQFFGSGAGLVTLNPYTDVDARIGYRFGSPRNGLTLSLVVTDLFDDKHLEYPNLASPGQTPDVAAIRRSMYVSLGCKF